MSETIETEEVSLEKKAAESVASEGKNSDKKTDKPQKQSFFTGVKAEFKKIIWPDKTKMYKSTTAVILVSIFVAIAVKISDLLIQAVLDLLL